MAQADRSKVPQAFWNAVAAIGVPPAALLRQARLPATLHLGGQAFLTTAQYYAMMRALEELSGEQALGLRLIRDVDTAAYPPFSLVAFFARDYRDGLARLARYKRLCTPEQLRIVEADGECTISMDWPFATEAEPAISVDITFASLVELGRRGTGRTIVPRRVDLARPLSSTVAHADYFGCSIRVDAPRDRLVLDVADLDRPFQGHNPDMLEMLTPMLGAALCELDAQSSVSEQVKVVLKRGLASGPPSLANVAEQMGLSDRTLQRRITDEGTTFRDLLTEARRDLSQRLLIDPGTDIGEVACLLGYQDTTSFYRAFREWEGVPPNRWRASQRSLAEASNQSSDVIPFEPTRKLS